MTVKSITHLKPDTRNANKGTQRGRGMVEASLREVGAGRSIVADKDGRVIAGNKTLEAAIDIGLPIEIVHTDGTKLIVVQRDDLDLSDDTGPARKLAYYDNRTSEVGLDWDVDQLLADAQAGLDLQGLFEQNELDAMLAELTPPMAGSDTEPQIDKAEELRQKWQTSTGQLWQLGQHRLICGDCTDKATVERLMGGERAQLLVTSPPYGVGKEYEVGGVDEWRKTVNGCFSVASHCADVWFVNLANRRTGNDGYEINTFGLMVSDFESLGFGLIATRIWIKDPAWAGQAPYWTHTYKAIDDFEFLGTFAQGKPKYQKRLTNDEYKEWGWRGVWEIASVRSNEIHSAMFPLEIPERAIKLLSDQSELIYDPFLGSGTTLIAAHNLNRRCFGAEISPAYCGVILQRFFDHTGIQPQLMA